MSAKKSVLLLVVALAATAAASASPVTWGSATLSDNDGGAFLSGALLTISGSQLILDLPNFSQSDFAAFSGQVDLGITAHDARIGFIGATFTYLAAFTEPGQTFYAHYAGVNNGAGAFSSSPFSRTFNMAPVHDLDLGTTLNLDDLGGSAGVSQIRIDLVSAVPEPGTISLLGGVLIAMGGMLRKRTSRSV